MVELGEDGARDKLRAARAAEVYRVAVGHEAAVVRPVAGQVNVGKQRDGSSVVEAQVEKPRIQAAEDGLGRGAVEVHQVTVAEEHARAGPVAEHDDGLIQRHAHQVGDSDVVEGRVHRAADELRHVADEVDEVAVGEVAAVVQPVAPHADVLVERDARQVAPGDVPELVHARAADDLRPRAAEEAGVARVHAAHQVVAVEGARVGEAAQPGHVLEEADVGAADDVPAVEAERRVATHRLHVAPGAVEVHRETARRETARIEVVVAGDVDVGGQAHAGRVVDVEVVEVGRGVGVNDLGHRAAEAHEVARRDAPDYLVAVEHARVHEAAQHVDVLVQRDGNEVVERDVVEVRDLGAADKLGRRAAENHRVRAAEEQAVVQPVAEHGDVAHQREADGVGDGDVVVDAGAAAADGLAGAATEHHAVARGPKGAVHHEVVQEDGVDAQVQDRAAVHVHVVERADGRAADKLRTARAVEVYVVAAAPHESAVVVPAGVHVQHVVHRQGRAAIDVHVAHLQRISAVDVLGPRAREVPA